MEKIHIGGEDSYHVRKNHMNRTYVEESHGEKHAWKYHVLNSHMCCPLPWLPSISINAIFTTASSTK